MTQPGEEQSQDMDLTTRVKLGLYDHIARASRVPLRAELAEELRLAVDEVDRAFRDLARQRLLVLEKDTSEIRMAPPFSAVDTPHHALVGGRSYTANCVWDAFGVVAALGGTGVAITKVGGVGEVLRFPVKNGRPERVPAVFHYAVPAAKWWEDIVFT